MPVSCHFQGYEALLRTGKRRYIKYHAFFSFAFAFSHPERHGDLDLWPFRSPRRRHAPRRWRRSSYSIRVLSSLKFVGFSAPKIRWIFVNGSKRPDHLSFWRLNWVTSNSFVAYFLYSSSNIWLPTLIFIVLSYSIDFPHSLPSSSSHLHPVITEANLLVILWWWFVLLSQTDPSRRFNSTFTLNAFLPFPVVLTTVCAFSYIAMTAFTNHGRTFHQFSACWYRTIRRTDRKQTTDMSDP